MKPPHEPRTQAQPEKSKREQTETKDATRDGKGPSGLPAEKRHRFCHIDPAGAFVASRPGLATNGIAR